MPLKIRSKFNVPKFIPRKTASLSNLSIQASQDFDAPVITAHLGTKDVIFNKGHWSIAGQSNDGLPLSSVNSQDSKQMKHVNRQLVEENKFLKTKIDIILNMLSETTATVHLQENEIDELKIIIKKN